MNYASKILTLNKEELIEIIKNNRDKKSVDIDNQLIRVIDIFYGRFSIKQLSWIFSKVQFICRTNKKYKEFESVKNICLV